MSKKKTYHIGVIKNSEIKKSIRKPVCPPSFRLKDKTEYERKPRNNKPTELEE